MTATVAAPERANGARRLGEGAVPPSGRPRNAAKWAVAVLLVLGGGLVTLQLYRTAGQKVSVIMTSRDVPTGAVLTRDDLESVEVNAEGVAVIPVEEADSVLGRVALGPLPAGSVVTRGQVGERAPLAEGRGVLSVPVPQGQVPVGLRADSRVALLVVDAEVVASTSVDRVEGRVVEVIDSGGSTGLVVVSVEIAEGDALPVARAAANGGKVAVLLLADGPG